MFPLPSCELSIVLAKDRGAWGRDPATTKLTIASTFPLFQDLYWLYFDADDKNHRCSSYYVTNKACFDIIRDPLHLCHLTPLQLLFSVHLL